MVSICNFLPAKNYIGNIKTVHFVYEADFASLKQPFIRPIYYAHIVTNGTAILKFADKSVKLSVGSLFFFFPAVPYEITASNDFAYIYISFMGMCIPELFNMLGIELNRSVFHGYSALCDIWINSIVRINDTNANILTESMLLYAFSFLAPQEKANFARIAKKPFDLIVDYVDLHFNEPDLTLKRVVDVFAYTEKHLSHLFKSKMNVGFKDYLVNLRMQYAHKLIADGLTSISEIAIRCGYNDSLYFSKAFKKRVGISPTKYIAKQ